jgi:hypothetical protein
MRAPSSAHPARDILAGGLKSRDPEVVDLHPLLGTPSRLFLMSVCHPSSDQPSANDAEIGRGTSPELRRVST